MCRSTHYPSHSVHHLLGDGDRDPFRFNDFDFDVFVPIREININIDDKKKIMPVAKTRKQRKLKLEDIPEETELHVDDDDIDDDDSNPELEEACMHLETDLQVLRRSLDVGIWVLCLGLGIVVSRGTSVTKFRTLPKFSSLISSSFL